MKFTFPNEPLPSTIKKLKSVERIMSFLDMLWGRSRSTEVIFFVIDVFCMFFMQIINMECRKRVIYDWKMCSGHIPAFGFWAERDRYPRLELVHYKIHPLRPLVIWTIHRPDSAKIKKKKCQTDRSIQIQSIDWTMHLPLWFPKYQTKANPWNRFGTYDPNPIPRSKFDGRDLLFSNRCFFIE